MRELSEEAGVEGKIVELIGVYDDLKRDPVRRTVCVSYLVRLKEKVFLNAGDDAGEVKWFSLKKLPKMAFDHRKQLRDAFKLVRFKEMSFE